MMYKVRAVEEALTSGLQTHTYSHAPTQACTLSSTHPCINTQKRCRNFWNALGGLEVSTKVSAIIRGLESKEMDVLGILAAYCLCNLEESLW